ncbi:DNA-binding protein REB1-like [Forsythia ovata]|uniref:DNA-binding protein REB1-like n=1 Tax=Forsythia ovata TaxID=205694 RepID=A0ABD1QSR3_9LAMI
MKSGKEVENGTKNKKMGRDYKDGYTENKGRKKDRKEIGKCSEIIEVNAMEKVKGKKRKREKKQGKDDGSGQQDTLTEASANSKTDDDLTTDKLLDGEKKSEKVVETFIDGQDGQDILTQDSVDTEGNVHLTLDQTRDNEVEDGNKGKKKKPKLVDNVRFSSHVEVFSPIDDSNAVTGNDEGDNLVRGKRFTREEDEIVEAAVYKYIEEHDLGEEGLKMVLNSKKYPKVKNCWKEIRTAIPYRPHNAVYFRA